MHRLRELDFLRGIAIILVLFRHLDLTKFTTSIGWTGVDLFFVLSGFLVSGLLFKEYQQSGKIDAKRFLIRRGFKIYPIYYLTYPAYLIFEHFIPYPRSRLGILSDLTFTQNYTIGWGYAYSASWSLAVEEHFYFLLALLLWLGITYNKISFSKPMRGSKGKIAFGACVIWIMAICLIVRTGSNYFFPGYMPMNFTMTHLRIDSLLAGVLIAYLYYFHLDLLISKWRAYKNVLYIICVSGLAWVPFTGTLTSFFAKTIGFTLLYISFGILLLHFLLNANINQKLDKLFSAYLTNLVSKIGYCSYSIYIIHLLVIQLEARLIKHFDLYNNYLVNFFLCSALSILAGVAMTSYIEKYFLSLRDKWYPRRTAMEIK